jgi:radical SAM superfamily enzyme YgiQ (UPF0313 family)
MRTLLANPPWLRSGWYGVRAGSRWPHLERADSPYMPFPFLMGYAAAVLEADGRDVRAIDACAERIDRDTFVGRVLADPPEVFVAEISTPSLSEDLATVAALRRGGFEGTVLLAGLHKEMYGADFLAAHPGIDGTLVGEYELTLRTLLRVWERGRTSLSEPIPGLILRQRDGVSDGGRKPSQQALDTLPWPARHLFPMDRYHDLPGGIPAPSVQMWASRGCSFTCSFCAWPQILYADHLYRTRSPQEVAREMRAMIDAGYRSLYFDDDTFNLGKKRTAELADAFAEAELGTPWAFMGRADTCEPSQYEDLVRTGLRAVKYGVESADTARLKRIGKNLDVDRVRASVAAARSLGVKVHLTFMFGLPGETAETMQRTLDLAYELDPDSAQFTIAVPFPGSRLHGELRAEGRLDDIDFADLDGYRTGVVRTDALEAEQIVSFVHSVHRRWEKRPRGSEAPRIPIGEIGASDLCFAVFPGPGEAAWTREALLRARNDEGPSREILIVADEGDDTVIAAAAEACDWATLLTVGPGEPLAGRLARVPDACTARWIVCMAQGLLPAPGFVRAALRGIADTGEAGALLPARGDRLAAVEMGGAVLGASFRGGILSRALLEDVGAIDISLPDELAAADLALRGLVLGWRHGELPAARWDGSPAGATDARALSRGTLRLLLKSMPREVWERRGAGLLLGALAASLRGGEPVAALRGWVDGVRAAGESVALRKAALGRRRVGPEFVLAALADPP